MAMITCKSCGGNLILVPGQSVAECDSCGTLQTVPSADSEKKLNLFTRANQLRAACDFDKAAGVYESIVAEFPKEAEAYWGLILCKYGIEYVDDYATGKKIPTCHRSSFDSILTDPDYTQALNHADVLAERVYREEVQQLEKIRQGIVEVSNREEPYDIFICYKETDPNGRRTLDSVIAQDIYGLLTEKGYRVFFSRVTLRDKLGLEYEPYIFAALNSAKVMLAIGTHVDYYNAVWVRNEWSRYLKLMGKDRSKRLFPVYKGIGPYDLPQEMQRLQALNYGELGADQDLLMGIEKVIPKAKPAPVYAPQPAPVYAPQPAPAPVGGQAEQEAVALIKKGMKINAIKVVREAYGLSLREAKDWADAAEQGNVRLLGSAQTISAPPQAPRNVEAAPNGGATMKCKMCGEVIKLIPGQSNATCPYCGSVMTVSGATPTPAPAQEPGGVEREAVNLVHRGRYSEAIQLLRDRFGWSKSKAEIWVSAVEQAGGVPSAADIARVEAHREVERSRKAEAQHAAAAANQAPKKQIPKGINDIAALLQANRSQEAIQLTGECYDLMGSKAADACRRIAIALRNERYPRPEVPLAGEQFERAWESASKAFNEMRSVVLEVQKNEAKVAEMVRAYNMATSEVKRNDYSSKIEYYTGQVRYYFGRIGRWASDLEQAEAILKPAIEERKKAIESIQAYKRQEAERGLGRVFFTVEGSTKMLAPADGVRYVFILDGNPNNYIQVVADSKNAVVARDLLGGNHTVELQVFGNNATEPYMKAGPMQFQVVRDRAVRILANRPGLFSSLSMKIEYQR